MRVRDLLKELEKIGPEKTIIVSCKGKCFSPQHIQIINSEVEICCGWAEKEQEKKKAAI